MQKEVERLREEIETLVTAAYQQDEAEEAALGSRRGDELPAALARREDRVAKIEEAMRRLEAQAKREADAERQRRAEVDAERQRTGQTRQGKVPKHHAHEQQGVGVLWQGASQCGRGLSDHRGP